MTDTTNVSTRAESGRWRMLLLTMFCYLFFYTGRHNFGWATHQLADTLGISFEKVGWISFAMLAGYAFGQLVNGLLADRLSPRHMILTGGILSVLANICISFSSSFTVILVLWGLNGYFQSMAWAPGSRIIANWWHNGNRGLAYGLYTMSAGLSSVVTYVFSILLVQDNWRNVFRVPVLFLAVAVVIFFIFVKNAPPGAAAPHPPTGDQPHPKNTFAVITGNARFLAVCLSLGFQSMARYALIFWLPLFFIKSGSVWTSLLLPLGMAAGAISFGFISDSVFRANRMASICMGMLFCSLLSGLIYVLEIRSGVAAGALIFCAGFFAYGPQANFWPLAQELLGQRYVGTGTGVMNMTAYLFAAIGEPLMGKLIDMTGNKAVIFPTVAIIALLSAVTILFAMPRRPSPGSLSRIPAF
ncbi:MFS transporter [Chitinophaga caseinilytica]|uniref:MFS transporter n=1 Tax=Chitinophaga caseinilytica TaxID=2267521 RepID=UPI003C2C910A